ncbi:MAG TPA: hypothetical protein VIJ22_14630 [Polyangiaceae bacterium]
MLACCWAVVAGACNSGSSNLSDIGSGSSSGSSSSGGVVRPDGGSSGGSSGGMDASRPDTGPDAGVDSATDATADVVSLPEGGPDFDASVFGDVTIGPPADAAQDAVPPTDASGHGNGNVCSQQLAWSMVGASLDSNVSAGAATALNPLLSVQNPITLAESFLDGGTSDAGPSWIFVSGTETNGVSQQYFPFMYPTSPAALVQTPGANPVFTATSPAGQPSTGWIRLLDSTSAEVWIALTNISATLTAGDAQCQSLSSSEVDAVVPTSAGTTTMVLGSGSTTVSTVFGATTSSSPAGWNIRLTFTGQKAQVTFK